MPTHLEVDTFHSIRENVDLLVEVDGGLRNYQSHSQGQKRQHLLVVGKEKLRGTANVASLLPLGIHVFFLQKVHVNPLTLCVRKYHK